MSIVRVSKRENPYVQIDKRALSDSRLSFRAKGILAYLLSKPDAWEVSLSDLISTGTEGRNAVQAALAELKEFGYAKLMPVHGEKGRLAGKTWVISEVPDGGFPSHRQTEKPFIGEMATDKPKNRSSVFRGHSNNEYSSNNDFNNSSSEGDFFSNEPEAENETPPPVAPPPPAGPGEAGPKRYGIDLEEAALNMKCDWRASEMFQRETRKPADQFAEAVDKFKNDQQALLSTYHNERDFRQHFFNTLRIKSSSASHHQQSSRQKPGIRQLGADPSKYQEQQAF